MLGISQIQQKIQIGHIPGVGFKEAIRMYSSLKQPLPFIILITNLEDNK